MPYIKRADHEANERLINSMAENEFKARKSAFRWRVVSIALAIVYLYSLG